MGAQGISDRAGSCACVCFLIENTTYIVNLGNSRVTMSIDRGKNTFSFLMIINLKMKN